jgi:WD40 repeat protein
LVGGGGWLKSWAGYTSVWAVGALLERGQALSAGSDGTVRLWDLASGQEVRRFAGHSGGVKAVAVLHERNQALSAGNDGAVWLWDLASGQEVQRFAGHSGGVRAVAALPDRGQALSAGEDGTVRPSRSRTHLESHTRTEGSSLGARHRIWLPPKKESLRRWSSDAFLLFSRLPICFGKSNCACRASSPTSITSWMNGA